MAVILAESRVVDRSVWLADSFEGLLPADPVKDGGFDSALINKGGLAVGLDSVQQNLERLGLLSDQVKFLPGWFCDTLPKEPIGRIAVLRLNGDFYALTMDALSALYHRVSLGGYVIIDDYFLDPCRNAVRDLRGQHGITDKIRKTDHTGVYWRKSTAAIGGKE